MREEIIGKWVKIVKSPNVSYVGIEGRCVDETKNMLIIENHKIRRIVKKNAVFEIEGKIVDGKNIVGRPEERLKR